MSSTIRSRPIASNNNNSSKPPESSPSTPSLSTSSSSSFSDREPSLSPSPTRQQKAIPDPSNEQISRLPSTLDILRILLTLLLLSSTLSYFITSNSLLWGYRPSWTRPARIRAWLRGPLTLSPAELSLYNGTSPHLPILLALNSSIYDVSSSPHLYGPGGAYQFFSGRDATRAFVTGCFDSDLTGDLRGVEEMFVPIYSDEEEEEGGGHEVVVPTKVKKVRRERDLRVARKKVEEVVRGWEGLFDGGKGGKYFWVGRVDRRGEGWGARRELCEKAREARPRRGRDDGVGDGDGSGVRRAEDV